jgi:hypothetical protein
MIKRDDQIQPAAIARFFSSTVLKELAARGKSPTLARLMRESGVLKACSQSGDVGAFFDLAFEYLKQRNNRHEYIYKAAITKKVLLGVHSLQTASMLTEFRVGRCKADVVILNGTGAVYEIKSERDGLTRLQNQITSYMKVFATVNVIVGENHLDDVLAKVPQEVGVLKLSENCHISSVRVGEDDASRTCSASIFDTINLREAETVLNGIGINIPKLPNTQRYGALRKAFVDIDPEVAHRGMVKVLKRTRNLLPLKSLLKALPESLHSVSLSTRLRKRDRDRLVLALKTPVRTAVCWG